MLAPIKKLIFIFLFNISLFFMLLMGIQNSSNKTKVDFLLLKTVNLPISFVLGVSFIGGSIVGNLLSLNINNGENNRKLKRN